MVICLEQGADLHMAQMMPLSLNVSCFRKIQTGFTFLVPGHLSRPGQRAVNNLTNCNTNLPAVFDPDGPSLATIYGNCLVKKNSHFNSGSI